MKNEYDLKKGKRNPERAVRLKKQAMGRISVKEERMSPEAKSKASPK